ncbi:MAG: hypothetical protein ABS01_05065 [Pelagibacteraceae bacterium BACL5 MAG-120705-bin12]|jgi:hypothetical protein|uniref:hypothetical protein n=1 Tax=Candidatus Pelagibacter sp. TaxID=2024849 RepID=UPI000714E840|nr:MAG: hypothetical protein ABS04_07615 [Pelagibacteraceae bacterium BACL5 MAG-121015-bin10]KRO59860.1 MAG: hypothetical protein ABS05_04355 [Pelagibacteraceae bacterium BACL5 MAG-121128-bin54]KRO61170.1 MAG: hypothetical protein ABS01_05065 [Pelagibacteraceae bacterium BACL5 MAG-120705-bin12]KRO64959.1 MAG: hypothetical protein ABS03_02735 [Pelagibacteraceae bacterium BACL5 MAG-120820-bin39]
MKIELRNPNVVMKLSRLGSFHQSKLSFLRSFLNEFKDWEYKRDLFDLDDEGFGSAVYSFKKKDRIYSLVCFANKISDDERSDRVIATKWDAAFTLYDGSPAREDIERLKNEVPKQEVGRLSYKELTLSRANKSVRVFDHVVNNLSEGKQPDLDLLSSVGYLYRTTAVYGSGKFGLADRFRIKNREEINGPFRLEMMLVYLVRQFTFDQVNHVAKCKNPTKAVSLDKRICKNLGIGNSTGLGMAPFIVNHPTLLNNWILAREIALKKIREIKQVKSQDSLLFKNSLKKSLVNITSWNTESTYQQKKIKDLLKDVQKVIKFTENDFNFNEEYPFNKIYLWLEQNSCEECTEYVVSIMMEPFDDIIKPLIHQMSSDEDRYFNIPTSRKVNELKNILEDKYSEVLNIDFDKKENNQKFWFISKNKEEPRLADRYIEQGSELEQPLAIARDIKRLYERIKSLNKDVSIAEFLINNSDLRHVVRRAFIIEKFPYSEIQDNTISEKIIPIDMLRLKLSFFGALKFDPRSDKWLRICMFQGAPLPTDLKNYDDQWVYNLDQ